MCETCGCAMTTHEHDSTTIEVLENLQAQNDHAAQHNRQHFDQAGVTVINLMSAPGSGKTRLLEATIEALSPHWRIAVIEGDLETENDAQRIRNKGVPALQITTGSACHLDAHMIHQAVHDFSDPNLEQAIILNDIDLLFIENVGNLVCPASFDLGQHYNVVLLSTPEGDDKPQKYPVMFRNADVVLITKTDLLLVLDEFNCSAVKQHIQKLANPAPVFEISAKQGDIDPWLSWLQQQLQKRLQQQLAIKHKPQATHRHAVALT